jgi:Transglutaminase-like superfamily
MRDQHQARMSPWSRRLLVLEAMMWLLIARTAIACIPFARIGKYLGTLQPPSSMSTPEDIQRDPIHHIAWAVNRAVNMLPFRMVCLPRGLAAWQMLHRRQLPGHLHFGVVKDACATISSHAWLDVCGVEVTGYPEAYDCVEIGYYAR